MFEDIGIQLGFAHIDTDVDFVRVRFHCVKNPCRTPQYPAPCHPSPTALYTSSLQCLALHSGYTRAEPAYMRSARVPVGRRGC